MTEKTTQERVQAYNIESFAQIRKDPDKAWALNDVQEYLAELEAAIKAGDGGALGPLQHTRRNDFEMAVRGLSDFRRRLRVALAENGDRVRAEDAEAQRRMEEAEAAKVREAKEREDRRAEQKRIKALLKEQF